MQIAILGIAFLPLHVDCLDRLLDDTQAVHDRIQDASAAPRSFPELLESTSFLGGML